MKKINKNGLDYFPLTSDFTNSLMVRRILRDYGAEDVVILLSLLCEVYAKEGYYLEINDCEVEDIALNFTAATPQDVYRVIDFAVERGIFDASIYQEKQILTSREIQEVYALAKKKARRGATIRQDICLLSDEKDGGEAAGETNRTVKRVKTEVPKNETEVQETEARLQFVDETSEGEVSDYAKTDLKTEKEGLKMTKTVSKLQKQSSNIQFCSQRKEKKRKENKREENLLLNPPPGTEEDLPKREGGEISCREKPSGESSVPQEAVEAVPQGEQSAPATPPKGKRPPVTREMISALVPPDDGRKRNLRGLIEAMNQHRIEPEEQYAIIRKSDFGVIGHPVWKALYKLHECGGKIRLPGRFVLGY